jgi:pterin-4a-carbinolamine dehydratase
METQNVVEKNGTEVSVDKPGTKLRLPPGRDWLKEARLSDKLKAERVQLALRSMPGWAQVPGGKAIDRAWTFAEAGVAATFTAYVAAQAHAAQHPVELFLDGKRLLVTVWAPLSKGKRGSLTEAALHFAKKLG